MGESVRIRKVMSEGGHYATISRSRGDNQWRQLKLKGTEASRALTSFSSPWRASAQVYEQAFSLASVQALRAYAQVRRLWIFRELSPLPLRAVRREAPVAQL